MFRETVSDADGTFFVSGIVPGMYEITAELQGFKKFERKDIRLEIGKTATVDVQLAVGALEETVTVTAESPLVDVTSKEVGGNITGARARRAAVDQPQLHRLHRPAARASCPSISTESFGSRLDLGQRRGSAQQQLHARRRQQQRRRHRAARGHAGADAIEVGPGVPGHHQPVRRGVRPHDRRDHQRGHQERHERASTAAPSPSPRTPTGRPRTTSRRSATSPSRTRKRREFGGTLGGPIVKDKAHFFVSLERVMIDRGAAIVIPARPDLNWSPTTQDRVWNTMVEVRSAVQRQPHLGRPLAARDFAAAQPGSSAAGSSRRRRSREEDDKDQTVVGTLSSVLRQHEAEHAARRLDAGGRRVRQPLLQRQRPRPGRRASRRWRSRPSPTSRTTPRRRASTTPTRSRTRSRWFLPDKHGDHDIKFGAQYQYVDGRQHRRRTT